MKNKVQNDAINELRTYLSSVNNRRNKYVRFVFLCGKDIKETEDGELSNREIIKTILCKENNNIITILSEELFDKDKDLDLMSFEELLFDICDYLVIVVESVGSICELGAFSIVDDKDFEKLIIINDIDKKDSDSFINRGPISKIEKRGGKIIYSNIKSGGIFSNSEVMNTLNRIANDTENKQQKSINKDNSVNINSFIFEMLELIEILQPIDSNSLLNIYKKVKDFSFFTFVRNNGKDFTNEFSTSYCFHLMSNAGLINVENDMFTINNKYETKQFMFEMSRRTRNRLRNRLLCERYKDGENICSIR